MEETDMKHYKRKNKINSLQQSFLANRIEEQVLSGFEENEKIFYPFELTESELELFNSIEEVRD